MANVAHASLTGSNLHEPKGIENASTGQVYVANGSGTGSWTSLDVTAFTGMIADFTTPIAPAGWLELDGTDISTSTYANLYAAMSIQQTGSRTNGSPTISGLSSTTHMRAGYYVFGTGIASGTTISSVDGASQITLSGNASSSGTATVIVSPWLLNTGTIRLPNTTTAGRYRRSRTSTVHLGVTQADQILSHNHAGTTSVKAAHSHTFANDTSTENLAHAHPFTYDQATAATGGDGPFVSAISATGRAVSTQTNTQTVGHVHSYAGTTSEEPSHTHTFTSDNTGGTENRPLTLVVMTCVKT